MRRFLNHVIGTSASTADPNRTEDTVVVKHGREEYVFRFDVGAIGRGEVSVGELRGLVAERTGVERERVSLVGGGKKFADDKLGLRDVGVAPGGKVLCMASKGSVKGRGEVGEKDKEKEGEGGSQSGAAKRRKKKKGKTAATAATATATASALSSASTSTSTLHTQQAKPAALTPMQQIEAVRTAVRDKTGALTEAFLRNPPKEKKDREDEHRRLSETIMAELLRLDGVESEDPEVRRRRKEVVKEIQRVLESLDEGLRKGGE